MRVAKLYLQVVELLVLVVMVALGKVIANRNLMVPLDLLEPQVALMPVLVVLVVLAAMEEHLEILEPLEQLGQPVQTEMLEVV
jgi:hypothetical protein